MSSYFVFDKNQILVSYMSKKNIIVLVLSIMHFDKAINKNSIFLDILTKKQLQKKKIFIM